MFRESEALLQTYFHRLKSQRCKRKGNNNYEIKDSGYLGQQPVYKDMTEIQPINNGPKVSQYSIC